MSRQPHNYDNRLPEELKYRIIDKGQQHEVSAAEMDGQGGIAGYAKAHPDATIEMHDDSGSEYSVPIKRAQEMSDEGWMFTMSAEQPTPQQVIAANVIPAVGRAQLDRSRDALKENFDNRQQYRLQGGVDNKSVAGGMQYNPVTGHAQQTLIRPSGENVFSLPTANDYKDYSVGAQLREATKRLRELEAKRDNRAVEVDKEWIENNKDNKAPLSLLLARDTYAPKQITDNENRALALAINQTKDLIEKLEDQRDREQGIDVGFWRGFGRTAGDARTWDFGLGDMLDAITMLNADQLIGENATEGEKEAYNEMMRSIYDLQVAGQRYDHNANFWNRAGVMAGYMPSFIVDFVLTGGGFKGINAASKAASKAATKALGKEAIKNMSEMGVKSYIKQFGAKGLGQEVANYTIKALGVTADDLLIRAPLMANTIQAGKTGSAIIENKLGDVTIGDNGSYQFSNDKSWGEAAWQTEADQIIENYSEMVGTYLDPVLSGANIGKLANVFGAKRLSGMLAKADAGALGRISRQTQRIFGQMGLSNYVGEVGEEYYGQLWRTLLGLDSAYQQNPDGTRTNLFATGQFHGDIWGGMALSMGMMDATRHGVNAARYAYEKHKVNTADKKAGEIVGNEVWESLRQRIDNTSNEEMGDMFVTMTLDEQLNQEQKEAILDYMEKSMNFRGYNLASMADSRNTEKDPIRQEANESFIHGNDATDATDMQDIKNIYDLQLQQASQQLSPEVIAEIDSNPFNAISALRERGELSQPAIDYINARQAYEGMMQRIEDDINEAIEQNNAIVDKRTNKDTGLLQEATLKVQNDDGTDRRVHIIKGNIALRDDGTIDKDRSDRNIAILDVRTGEEEIVSPNAIFSVESPVDPAMEKAIAADAVRQSYTAQAEAKINGIVSFQPGDNYNILTPEGQFMQLQIVPNADGITDNGDGTVNVTSDGGQTIVAMSKDEIQGMVNAANIARVAGRIQPQQQQEQAIQQEEQQQGSVPDYYPGSSITFRDNDGNIVQGVVNAIVPDDNYVLVDIDTPNGLRVVPYKIDHINDNLESIADENGNVIYSRPQEEKRYTLMLSDEVDENGYHFILSSDGTSTFGYITRETGLTPAPIKLSEGFQDKNNKGYGLAHIENRHGKQIRDAGFNSIEEFVENVARNFTVIKRGNERGENETYLLEVQDAHNNTLFIELSQDGSYWNVNSAGVLKKAYSKKKDIVWTLPALGSSTNTDATEVNHGQSKGETVTSGNSPQTIPFDNKDNTNLPQIQEESALSRIPVDENGQPVYEQTDPATAWDAIVEQAEGNENIAISVVNSMISDKEAQLRKAEQSKPRKGTTIAEKIAAEQDRNNAIQQAQAELEHWKNIANVPANRHKAAQEEAKRLQDEQARENAARIERERQAKEEAERIEREALNGVPDVVDDTPKDARARGYRRVNGHKIDRQEPIPAAQGKEITVRFSDDTIPGGHVAVIDASMLQPSHIAGVRNPRHFIDEAQPKERKGSDSTLAATRIASNIRPEEITSSITAYTGAPTVNKRGEVIQGNNRSAALLEMWKNYPEQAAAYKQYLIDNAEEFGINPQDIMAIENPVLVNMLDVDDARAIKLGQYVASDTESGGTERIRPKNVIQKMGKDIRRFISNLLDSTDEEATFAQLIDRNGSDVLKWMNSKRHITPTQYVSAFNSKGALTDEAKNDLRNIIYQSIFEGASPQLEEMFNMLPSKAQKAILSTAYRDYDSPNTERLLSEIQNSIRVYYALSQYEPFANARNYAESRDAIRSWSNQYMLDNVTGDSYLPAERFNNFNLLLAAMYKGQTQKLIQSTFNNIYDLVQGVKEDSLFETSDNTPRSLADAINETINNFNLAENFEYNGQLGSNVLGGNTQTSQTGRQGGDGSPAPREQTENTERAAYDNRGTESGSGENKVTPKLFQYFTGTLSELVSQAKQSTQGLIKKVIAPISSRLKNDLNSQGLQIDNDYNHVIDNNAIRHILKKHSGKNEEKKGQIPITETDFQNIADVVANYDGVEVVSGNTHVQRIIYNKTYSDGTVVYVEEQRVGRKELAAVTMWKKKSPNLTDANRTETTLIPDLTEVSENKDTTNSSNVNEIGEKVANAEAETDTSPTEAQKEAGNYRKGHVKIGTFDVTIENPKGSIRSGTDARGNRWENTMNNTYGYLRGTEGVDGDHIDVFLSNDIDNWDNRQIFVIDQYNEDGTFDEHKVMLGFNDETDAFNAYLSNYNKGWEDTRKLTVTSSTLDDFKKWIDSSHRKTKPYSEYKSVIDKEREKDLAELQDFYDRTSSTGRTSVDKAKFKHDDLYLPITIDGKESPLAVQIFLSDDILDEPIIAATYNYAGEAENTSDNNWQLYGDLLDRYNNTASDQEWGTADGDAALISFRTVDAALKFHDWVNSQITGTLQQHTDAQGNPIDANGKLVVDKVYSIDELTDEDFYNPQRSVELPKLSQVVDDAIGAQGKPVVIKKNIFEKNRVNHPELSPEECRDILYRALYASTLIGQTQPMSRPTYWVAVQTADKNSMVVLEVNRNKDNTEIIGWRKVDIKGLEKMKRQAEREGGQFLILTSEDAAAALSALPFDLPSESKDTKKNGNIKASTEGTTKTENAHKSVEKIEDVGEKIGGAKKDRFKEFVEKEKQLQEKPDSFMEELRKLPVSKIFNFNLEALRKDGLSNEAATLIDVIRRIIPSKPRTDWKLKRWISDVFELYRFCLTLATAEQGTFDQVLERVTHIRKIGGMYRAQMALGGFDSGLDTGQATLEELGDTAGHYDKEGNWVSIKGQWYVTNAGRYGGIHPDYETAKEALSKFAGENSKTKEKGAEIKFSIYSYIKSGEAFITLKGKPNIVVESGFKSSKEALDYLNEHMDELQAKYRNMKDSASVDFKKNRRRKGKDWRGDKNVSAEDFRDTFGFRGVEFGNWINQEERQRAINDAYDAFMDLSEATGISPKGLSLGGELGMAFGARGGGSAAAHYEPGKVVINLTKTQGAGTLAHEWWHAIDNYFSRRRGQARGYNTERTGYKLPVKGGKVESEHEAERKEITKAFASLMKAISDSSYGERSNAYAKLKSSYWRKPTELGARAFAVWVERRLSEKGIINDFLANNNTRGWESLDLTQKYYPYPLESDFESLDAAFDNLFNVIEEKVDEETGNTILYHRPGDIIVLSEKEAALRDAIIDKLRKSGLEVITDVEAGQRVLDEVNGKRESRKRKSANDTGLPEQNALSKAAVISFADTANIRNNLEKIAKTYQDSNRTHTNTLLSELGRAINAEHKRSNSQYVTIEAKNGNIVTIRLGDHNVSVEKMNNAEKDNAISIVISRKGNEGIRDSGNAHIVEYFYSDKSLRKAGGKAIADIARSLQQTFYSGEYKDTTGLAEVQEVNAEDIREHRVYHGSGADSNIRFFKTSNGNSYGFTVGNKIYIDPRIASAETPIHEYAHLWASALRKNNPEEWQNIVGLMKNTPVWKEITDRYTELQSDDEIADEVLATYSGHRGAQRLRDEIKNAAQSKQPVTEKAEVVGAFARIREALRRFWKNVADLLNIRFTSAEEVADRVMNDLLEGINPARTIREQSINDQTKTNDDIRFSYTKVGNISMSENAKAAKKAGKTDVGLDPALARFIEKNGYGTFDDEYHHVGANYNRHYFVKLNDGVTLAQVRKAYKEYMQSEEKKKIDEILEMYPNAMPRQEVLEKGGRVFPMKNPTHRDVGYAGGQYWFVPNEDVSAEINERFNNELQQQIDGTLPKGHVYQLGRPSKTLLSTGIPDLPIELSSTRLAEKAGQRNHEFAIADVKGLPKAMQNPIAVFSYGNKDKSKNIIVEIERDGKNFVVGLHLNQYRQGIEVNSIRGIFPKDNAEWLNWITQGKLLYADKQKIQTLINKQRTNLADVEYLDLDPIANIVKSFENPSTEDETLRTTEQAPVTGNIPDMADRVQELAEKLHLDNVETVTTTSGLDGKKARAKGFYTKSTGKITIVLPNNRDIDDAIQTLLHEAVAHYGLRKMFGKQFDTFLDNVFNNADTDVRRRIVELSKKHGWNFRTATEEYLASLAEQTNFEETNPSWWQNIKELFLRMLHNIGLKDFSGTTLSDNELRYILWRGYENMKGNSLGDVFNDAVDTSMQYELKVGEYAADVQDDTMYRDGDPEIHERTLARDRYEQRVRSGMFQTQEALQDSMLSVREAMDAVLRAEGKKMHIEDIAGFENAYLGENRLSSVNKAEADAFAHTLFKPLLDEVARLSHNEEERMQLINYMMAKHGLERNKFMAERDAKESFEQEKDKYPNITLDDLIYEYRNRDYAGLTALTESESTAVAETKAMAMVDEYERNHDVVQLWQRTQAVNDAILSKLYETGMMSKATYDYVKGMYKYYIPLRGFDEKTSAEAYAYLTHKDSAFNAPIKKAIGRTSKADDPLAYMQSMAESAIMQGNRNKLVKQRFFNFVLNHPSDLASINDIWLQYDSVNDEWKPVFPDNINNNDTAEDVERKMQEFEEKMQALKDASPDMYKHGKETVNIPYKVVSNIDLHQHQIVVKRNGRDYIITINGNPRAAQAINGQTNPDNDLSGAIGTILKAAEKLNRQLSAFYTTRNPDFVVSNFIRDMLYANSMAWIRESPNYALRFHRNFLRANPAQMKVLFAKLRNNTLDMNDYLENMFYQFIMNGGETGYANIRDIENRKNDIRRELRRANGKLKIGKAVNLLGERLDEYNRAVENCARFAAFMTSREMGRTIDRSIYDAKEASVNFNKKGSGSKFYNSEGQTGIGNIASFISGLGRSSYVFWNAAIQGTTNFGRQAKRHPAKAFTGLAAAFILGALIAELGGDDDDDKNAYYNLPEYVRRSNIMFRAGDSWISIPLPVEYRAVYGLGELMTSTLKGKENLTDGEMANQIASQVSQILPLDLMNDGGLMGLVPSAVKPFAEVMANESWTGLPIYKDTPWNKDMPDWTKAYKSANKEMVGFAEMLNDISGGDEYTKGKIDINPAAIQHILEGYFGGVATTIDRLAQTAEIIAGQREYDPRSILLLNRVVKNGDERTEYRAINNEYFRLKDEHDRLRARVRNYEHDTKEGIFDYAEKLDFLYNSPEYARYEIFEKYRPDIDSLYDELKETVDENDRKEIETLLNEVKRRLVEEANTTRK